MQEEKLDLINDSKMKINTNDQNYVNKLKEI